MAPISELQMPRSIAAGIQSNASNVPYTSAVLLATFSFVMVLLIVPPMCWHFRNRNIGATMLVVWVIVLNVQSFINAVLWSNDDMKHWYNGVGLCDVEVKFQVASQVALPASLCCVLRALAEVMDTKRTILVKTKAQKIRGHAIDVLLCIGLPLLQMLLHYFVQQTRYYLYGISGCIPNVAASWVSIVLIYAPPALWTLVDAYYAIIILIRLYQYRQVFTSILANSSVPKSRFVRLYVLCLVWILGLVPTSSYLLWDNITTVTIAMVPFAWSAIHDPASQNSITMVPSQGKIIYDRYIWLAEAIIVFVFFGFGKEAVNMYRSGMVALGFDRIFPGLKSDNRRQGFVVGTTISSIGSKAKLLFKRKSLASSFTESSTSRPETATGSLSPKNVTFLETISEAQSQDDKRRPFQHYASDHLSIWKRLASVLKTSKTHTTTHEHPFRDPSGQQSAISSTASLDEHSSKLSGGSQASGPCEVIVRKEVKLDSVTAHTLSDTYHAV